MPIHSKAKVFRRTRHNASKAGFGREFEVRIDQERCKGCEYCVFFCPQEVLKIDMKSFNSSGYHPAMVKNPDKCKGCAICAREMCPEATIEIYREDSK